MVITGPWNATEEMAMNQRSVVRIWEFSRYFKKSFVSFVNSRISWKGVKIRILWNLFLKKLDVLVGFGTDLTVMCLKIFIFICEWNCAFTSICCLPVVLEWID